MEEHVAHVRVTVVVCVSVAIPAAISFNYKSNMQDSKLLYNMLKGFDHKIWHYLLTMASERACSFISRGTCCWSQCRLKLGGLM